MAEVFCRAQSASSGSFKAWIPCFDRISGPSNSASISASIRHPRHPPVVAWSSPQRSFSRYPREILQSSHKSRRWMAECLAGQAGQAGLPTTFKPPSGTGLDASCLAKEARHCWQTSAERLKIRSQKSKLFSITQLWGLKWSKINIPETRQLWIRKVFQVLEIWKSQLFYPVFLISNDSTWVNMSQLRHMPCKLDMLQDLHSRSSPRELPRVTTSPGKWPVTGQLASHGNMQRTTKNNI